VGTLGSPFPLLYPLFLSPLFPFSPVLSLTLPSSPLSGGNNFNNFPENQLTIDFACPCKPAWGNAITVPLVLVLFGETAFPTKYLGERTKYLEERRFPRFFSTTPLDVMSIFKILCEKHSQTRILRKRYTITVTITRFVQPQYCHVRLSVRPSVRPSVKRVNCDETKVPSEKVQHVCCDSY